MADNKNNTEKEKKGTKFSVGLGLLDYLNPIAYSTTSIIILTHVKDIFPKPSFLIYLAGVVLSMIFGFTIPTVKVLVGLGKFEFKMPVNFVFYVNFGILISGTVLLYNFMHMKPIALIVMLAAIVLFLAFIYAKTKKFNSVAVLTGSAGYILIYISLIAASLAKGMVAPVVLYAVAICLMILLVCIGCFSNLYNARVHWVIEASNATCQTCVVIATFLLFCR